MTAQPFLKWAGGKRQLLPRILPLVPAEIATYYEPFLGGGALFFALAAAGRFGRAVLSDANEELVITYRAIQVDVEGVIECLAKYRDSKRAFLRARAAKVIHLAEPEVAARMIFLNRCGFNGLYRVNASGQFNVPYGAHRKMRRCADPEALRCVARALDIGTVEIHVSDFGDATTEAGSGDFVYYDPPYIPLSKGSDFTAFTAGGFGFDEQEELAEMFAAVAATGAVPLLSNSDCQLTRFLYRRHKIVSVPARRAINSNARGRGSVREVLVLPRPRAVLEDADG